MIIRKRNAEQTRADILNAARRLFAELGITAVSIRTIADAAGISHGLVQQYFGTRENMVAEIIKHEIDVVMAAPPAVPSGTADVDLESMRQALRGGMERFRDFAVLITRAELAGVEPEKMLDPNIPTPAMKMAEVITNMQGECQPHDQPAMDPKIVSAYINAALFGFAAMTPWLMTSVGLAPEDYEKRFDEIAEITMKLIALAGGHARQTTDSLCSNTNLRTSDLNSAA